jgi:hypothetical protein
MPRNLNQDLLGELEAWQVSKHARVMERSNKVIDRAEVLLQ